MLHPSTLHRAGWRYVIHGRLYFHPSMSSDSSISAALCIQPKIWRARSFYLTWWLWRLIKSNTWILALWFITSSECSDSSGFMLKTFGSDGPLREGWNVRNQPLWTRDWDSVTSKKLPNVYRSCPKMISQIKLKVLTPLQKMPKNVRDMGKLIVAKAFEKLPKVQ